MTTVKNCILLCETHFLQHCKKPTVNNPPKGGVFNTVGFSTVGAAGIVSYSSKQDQGT